MPAIIVDGILCSRQQVDYMHIFTDRASLSVVVQFAATSVIK